MTNKEFKNSEQFSDGKYRVLKISDGSKDLRRITCETEGICLIPFDTSNGKIRNVYLARQMNYLQNQEDHSCICIESRGTYSSNFEEVESICKEEFVDQLAAYIYSLINNNTVVDSLESIFVSKPKSRAKVVHKKSDTEDIKLTEVDDE